MNKGLQILIIVLVLMSVLLLAGGHIAWAGQSTVQNVKADLKGPALSGFDVNAEPGSVKPPPIFVVIIPKTGGYSIGGICTILVDRLADDITIRGELLGYDSLDKKPDDNARYLAGVCFLTYHKKGVFITLLAPADGTVRICFAALPKILGKISIYDGGVWTILDTVLENSTNCAPAHYSGKYVLMTTQH